MNREFRQKCAAQTFDLIREFCKDALEPTFALKRLNEFSEVGVRTKALQRMTNEVAILEEMRHPSLIRIVDSRVSEQWFVMDHIRNARKQSQQNQRRSFGVIDRIPSPCRSCSEVA